MNKTMKAKILFFEKKRQEALEKKNLAAYLLELIQVTQKEVIMQTMKFSLDGVHLIAVRGLIH